MPSKFEIALAKSKKTKSVPAVSKRQIVPNKIDNPHMKTLLAKQKKKPLPKTMEAYKDNNREKKGNKYITSHDKTTGATRTEAELKKKKKYNKD